MMMKRSGSLIKLSSNKCPKFNGDGAAVVVENESDKSEIPLLDELLSEIIRKYVPLHRWSSCLEFVSRQFQRCVTIAYSRKKSINIKKLFPLKIEKKFFPRKSSFPLKNRFRPKSVAWLNGVLRKISFVCPHLIELSGFEFVVSTFAESNRNTLKKLAYLETVSFDRVNFPAQFFANFIADFKKLKTLRVTDCCIHMDDFRGTYDIPPLNNFAFVNVRYSPYLNFANLNNWTEILTTLEVESPKGLFKENEDGAETLKKFKNLESLSVQLNLVLDYKIIFETLPHLHKLTRLRLETKAESDIFGRELVNSLDSLKNQLISFELCGERSCVFLQKFLFTECLRLKRLVLTPYCYTLANINLLPKLSETLEKLTISNRFFQFTCPDFLNNVSYLSNLTELNLEDASNWSTVEWENICSLEKLRNLRLPGRCISNSVLQKWDQIGKKMYENLVSFEISGCNEVSDAGAALFAKKAINLEILDFEKSRITDLTVSALVNVAKKLRRANFKQSGSYIENSSTIVRLIEKSVYLKKLIISKKLALKVVQNVGFLPFVDDVEISMG